MNEVHPLKRSTPSPDRLDIAGPALAPLMREVLESGAAFRFRARGSSMSPFIRDGDAITIAPLPCARARMGDVVAFVRPGQASVVVHRVIGRGGETGLLILGDNAAGHADELVARACVLGRVTRVERNARPVRLGLGLERYAIAWLSRAGLLRLLRRLLVHPGASESHPRG